MFGEKALKLAHLLLHAQREVNMIAEVAQTASDGLVALDSEKVDKADIDTIIHSLHAAIFRGGSPRCALQQQRHGNDDGRRHGNLCNQEV